MNRHYLRAPASGWSFKLLGALAGMAWGAVVAGLATVFGRLRGKPTHPAWSFVVEWIVGTLRRALAGGLRSLEVARLVPPSAIPSTHSGRVGHGHGVIAGRPFESFTPQGWTDDGATCLYLHGGGYVTCSPATHRGLVAEIAAATGLRCISLDYRLAPEHPYPAAVQDSDDAMQALIDAGASASNIWIGGDSAGGGLALATMLRRRERGADLPRGALLLSPWVDLLGTGETVLSNARYDYLPAPLLRTFASYYHGDADPRLPELSPVHADLHGLPPLLVVTGGAELFASENRELVANAQRDGVHVQHLQADAMVHVYPAVLPFARQTRDAMRAIATFVADHTIVRQ